MPTTVDELVQAAKAQITEIDVAEAERLRAAGVTFVDVREPAEWEQGTVPGALTIPRGLIEWKAGSEPALADRDAPVVVYCQGGGRSALAAQSLEALGFTGVKSLAGGYKAWSERG